ncbi:transporter substrate-binding domain-containing protein [Blautia wexlerae]|nr:transporter substrate-binding domain-containing protein [Blautia wexlerae]
MSGKKRNVMLFVLLFTLFLGVIVPVQAQSYGGTKTIRVAYRENADFINKSDSGVYKGYGVEYLNKISQYTGWRYEYINESWENQLADLKSGKVDLICNAQKNRCQGGFRILMDDFGSGYSSLNMLKEAPVDEIKLDMRFLSAKQILMEEQKKSCT